MARSNGHRSRTRQVAIYILLIPIAFPCWVLCFCLPKPKRDQRRGHRDPESFHDNRELAMQDLSRLDPDGDKEELAFQELGCLPSEAPSSAPLTFRLFSLPPELWLRICTMSIVSPSPINITRFRMANNQCRLVAQPPLTRVCQLLRRELLPVYYRQNDFEAKHLSNVACIRQWFPAIGIDNCLAMGTFTFYAKFEPQFWETKFASMGIEVDIEQAENKTTRREGETMDLRYQKLVVKFIKPVSTKGRLHVSHGETTV